MANMGGRIRAVSNNYHRWQQRQGGIPVLVVGPVHQLAAQRLGRGQVGEAARIAPVILQVALLIQQLPVDLSRGQVHEALAVERSEHLLALGRQAGLYFTVKRRQSGVLPMLPVVHVIPSPL